MPVPGGVIFCDDVRREASGKDIVVGIYANNIILPQLPVTIGSLWTISTITFEKDEEASEICLRLILPDDRELRQAPFKLPRFEPLQDDAGYRMLKFRSHFQEVEVNSRGRIRLIAEVDGKDMRLGGLDVLDAAAISPPSAGGAIQSYLQSVLGKIAEMPDDQRLSAITAWLKDFGSTVDPGGEVQDWEVNRALVLPAPNGIRALFARPLAPNEVVVISGLPTGVMAVEVSRTQFSVTFDLDHLPVPFFEIRVEATGKPRTRGSRAAVRTKAGSRRK